MFGCRVAYAGEALQLIFWHSEISSCNLHFVEFAGLEACWHARLHVLPIPSRSYIY